MTTYMESEGRPAFITRMRRLSKSNFDTESSSRSPRLDKMIAHVSLFEKTTKCLEEEIVQPQQAVLPVEMMKNARGRPQLGPRATEYQKKEDVPDWVTELTSRPAHAACIVVTEIEHVEDMDDESP